MLPVTILLTYLVPTTSGLVRFIKMFFYGGFLCFFSPRLCLIGLTDDVNTDALVPPLNVIRVTK